MFRMVDQDRRRVAFTLDGQPAEGKAGDTVLTAVLTLTGRLRLSEFEHQARAGFCLMGACQDCWIATAEGASVRACSTFLVEGMALLTDGSHTR